MTRQEKAIRNEAMRKYKAQGRTGQEVAEHFGVSLSTVHAVCKGVSPQKPDMKGKARNQWTSKDFSVRENKTIETINKFLPTFEYVGGFTHCDGSVELKCKECGAILTRSLIGIRHGNGVKCRECEKRRAEETKAEMAYRETRKTHNKELRRINNCTQTQMLMCRGCGELFVPLRKGQQYCSKRCYPSYSMGSDDRLNGTNTVDKDITLFKLFMRCNGTCQICGEPCDYDDYSRSESGAFIAGNNYPSIDHVVPISNGGKHSWDNVRLAHRICNVKIYAEQRNA